MPDAGWARDDPCGYLFGALDDDELADATDQVEPGRRAEVAPAGARRPERRLFEAVRRALGNPMPSPIR